MLSIRQPHFFHLNNFNTKHCLRLVFALARKDIQFTQKKKPCLKDEFFKNKICCYQLCIKKKKKKTMHVQNIYKDIHSYIILKSNVILFFIK